jgi:DNA-binding MarR family transcriptional regulator
VGEVLDNAPEDLTPGEFLVLLTVAEDAREKDRLASHSDLESLVRRTRLRPGTIRNALSELVDRGLLIAQRKTTYRGGYGHQEYVVTRLEMYHRQAIRRGRP